MKLSRRLVAAAVVLAGVLVTVPLIALARGNGHGRPPANGSQPPLAAPRQTIVHSEKNDVSRPLRSIAPIPPKAREEAPENRQIPGLGALAPSQQAADPIVQTAAPTAAMPSSTSFEGLSHADNSVDVIPPDTNGDVGPNNYVEFVNLAFAIYSKTGTRLYGPADGSTLWTGFGGPCELDNDGDPIVQYDSISNRWLLSQFALPNYPSGPFWQCIAVSTTSDPTGSYYRYAFKFSDTTLNDYPKFGVWPDAYYMSVVEFDASGNYAGPGAVAYDRAKMIAGQAATAIQFDLGSSRRPMLPSDLDGPTPPPAGAPDYFGELVDGTTTDKLNVWAFHVDWTTPASSTFTLRDSLTTAAFDTGIVWVDEPAGFDQWLDAIADRPMYRFAYRNLGTHESLVMNHTVNVSGHAGVRWYELRKTTGPWSIFQQSTFSPNADSRWMGSIAMDRDGDIAVGYSVSSTSVDPSIRYAGRLASDPAGALTQGEATMQAGSGIETDFSGRWGDYSSMSVAPTDDCTFWYANEYFPTTSDRGWHTRIGSFKFPSCGPVAISGFAPTSGSVGTSVTIQGGDFTGATAVSFNGTAATTFSVDSSTQITATVPTGATTGKISVTSPLGSATSATNFTVTAPAVPTVSSFTPGSGAVGTVVTVTGTNFGGVTAVTFGGVAAAPTVVSSTQARATVPADAKTGKIGVTTPDGSGLSAAVFKVSPKLSSFGPGSAAAGATVTIAGSGFTDVSAVKFGSVAASYTVDSSIQISATVPGAATSGAVSVTTAGGTATSAASFKAVPTITSWIPPGAAAGTTVTVDGTGFGGVSSVKVHGTSAAFTVLSPTQLRFTVPSSATSGPISVTTGGGTATSSVPFSVYPKVTSFSPSSAPVGATVTVNGSGFGGASVVLFNGVEVAPFNVTASSLKAIVPSDASTGKLTVVTTAATGQSTGIFKVLPKLIFFSPTLGVAGTSVTIAGSGFTDVSAVKFGGVAASSFTVDSSIQITADVPDAAATGQVSVTTAGGTATSASSLKVPPTITGFAPGSAAAGSPVTVDGTGFGGVSSVKVNGVSASFSVLSRTQLKLTVPGSAATGPITVTTAGGTAASNALFVLPRVTGFSPSSAPVGSTVTVTGNAFGGATSVLFDGVIALPFSVTAGSLKVVVPTDASTGKLTVVTGAGSGQSSGTFKVVPKLTSFGPPSGPAGASVTIAGSGFTDVSAVKFGGVAASYTVDSSIQITAQVPATAATGAISVTTAGGTATSATTFKAVPTITGFAPGSAPSGTAVTVDGTGFGGVSSVKVNGVAAGFSVLSRTQLKLTVPSSATSGTISVTTGGGTATSAATLAVLPKVTSFSPSSAPVGATVTLNGTAFGGAGSVLFDGVIAVPTSVTATTIKVVVPADASSGKLTVVTGAGSGQSATNFKVVPKLTSFGPPSGPPGTSVTIAGSGFTDVTAVRFGGVAAVAYTVDSSAQITATVPAGAVTGKVSVVTAGGTATSLTNFTVTP
jgi:IPT/TIG domain